MHECAIRGSIGYKGTWCLTYTYILLDESAVMFQWMRKVALFWYASTTLFIKVATIVERCEKANVLTIENLLYLNTISLLEFAV